MEPITIPADVPATTAALVAVLKFLAAPGFGGWFGSWLFDALRRRYPLPPSHHEAWARIPRWRWPLYRLLWHRPETVYTSRACTFLGGLIAAVAAGVLAHLLGGDVQGAVDEAMAVAIGGLLAVGVGEVRHQGQKKGNEGWVQWD